MSWPYKIYEFDSFSSLTIRKNINDNPNRYQLNDRICRFVYIYVDHNWVIQCKTYTTNEKNEMLKNEILINFIISCYLIIILLLRSKISIFTVTIYINNYFLRVFYAIYNFYLLIFIYKHAFMKIIKLKDIISIIIYFICVPWYLPESQI